MKLSKFGEEIIKEFEGFSLEAYKDSKGIPTIGWGSIHIFGRKVRMGDVITIEEAQEQFEIDAFKKIDAINDLLKVEISQKMFDAIASLSYNIGIGGFSKSTLLLKLNRGDFYGAAQEFVKWNKITVVRDGVKAKVAVKGLTKRRLKEADLFIDGIDEI